MDSEIQINAVQTNTARPNELKLDSVGKACGKVYLVGAGPGDPGLMTVKAKPLIESADDVEFEELVSEPILDWIGPRAE